MIENRDPLEKLEFLKNEMLVVRVASGNNWRNENAICFNGVSQYLVHVSSQDLIRRKKIITHPQPFQWMSAVVEEGHRLNFGPAVGVWFKHLAETLVIRSEATPVKLRAKEAAQYLGVCVSTLRLLRQSRKVGCYCVSPRNIWYFREELDAYLRLKSQPSIAI